MLWLNYTNRHSKRPIDSNRALEGFQPECMQLIYNTDALVCFLWFMLEGYSDVALIPTSQPWYQSCHQIDKKKRGGRMTMRQWTWKNGRVNSIMSTNTHYGTDQGSMSQRTAKGEHKIIAVLCQILLAKTLSSTQNIKSHRKQWSTSEKTNTAISTHVPSVLTTPDFPSGSVCYLQWEKPSPRVG